MKWADHEDEEEEDREEVESFDLPRSPDITLHGRNDVTDVDRYHKTNHRRPPSSSYTQNHPQASHSGAFKIPYIRTQVEIMDETEAIASAVKGRTEWKLNGDNWKLWLINMDWLTAAVVEKEASVGQREHDSLIGDQERVNYLLFGTFWTRAITRNLIRFDRDFIYILKWFSGSTFVGTGKDQLI